MSISLSALERDNPPPRRKSCAACIKSKRRCDVGFPTCQRCLHRQIECVYELASGPLRTDRPARQRRQQAAKQAGGVAAAPSCPAVTPQPGEKTPQVTSLETVGDLLPWDDLTSFGSPLPPFDPFSTHAPSNTLTTASSTDTLLNTADPSEFTMFQDADSLLDSILMTPAPPAPKSLEVYRGSIQEVEMGTGRLQFDFPAYQTNLPGPPVPFSMSQIFRSRLNFAVEELRRAPKLFLETTGTPWMHPLLYRDYMPPVIEDVYSACALFAAKNSTNGDLIMRSIDYRVAALVATPLANDAPLNEILARAQALILYQSMYLLDEKLSQLSSRTVSAPAATALEEVTYRLLDKVMEGLTQGQPHPHQSPATAVSSSSSSPSPADAARDDAPEAIAAAKTVQLQNTVPYMSETEHLPLSDMMDEAPPGLSHAGETACPIWPSVSPSSEASTSALLPAGDGASAFSNRQQKKSTCACVQFCGLFHSGSAVCAAIWASSEPGSGGVQRRRRCWFPPAPGQVCSLRMTKPGGRWGGWL
ncbi:hypothetical protein MAPG_09542 [Magnaporthiopsis poae ATCC 64411]|uniref:Zn(2)-C6 fungal-type domain-containing protein n=1 Tax=Magnaporthiopsis poae (strain ATCC 64411 / 73-15) TaxID=644358 RepID=A0A0C4EA83_MAGP6|nr:hypothetical protein MAPG_09542 [Magnaporthiopsis poae ATCC 64411]